ncbi:DUF1580 domain-containing protein [Tuwongella immobilis]|uniref:: DUF1580 n=1 Tax=Tuwongella immobilis TaxID=692036 RepID=A0A6C2YS19_9BACT|nr:DUF1580 domain-containing protein [Tuwongella immobilis]VIP03775.1 : DUF1580 [Tuwongella immobilis]VTS04918.1 : DUF1580 [Tuwongella immobilis]
MPQLVDSLPLLQEPRLTLAELARQIPSQRPGKRTHIETLRRWCSKGIRLATGQRIRLESLRECGKLTSSLAAYHRFIAAQQPIAPLQPIVAAMPTPSQREREKQLARQKLDSLLNIPSHGHQTPQSRSTS